MLHSHPYPALLGVEDLFRSSQLFFGATSLHRDADTGLGVIFSNALIARIKVSGDLRIGFEPSWNRCVLELLVVMDSSWRRIRHMQDDTVPAHKDLCFQGKRLLLSGVMLAAISFLLGSWNPLLRGIPQNVINIRERFSKFFQRADAFAGSLNDDLHTEHWCHFLNDAADR